MRLVAVALTLAAAAGVAVTARQARAPGADCGDLRADGVRCVAVVVPENRVTGRGRTITLRVAVLPALGDERLADPVFFLAGGPGQAATDFLRDPGLATDPLRRGRDFVFLDQRGTGKSNPLMCDFYPAEDYARAEFADFMPPARVNACRAALEPVADLSQYTTAASVADLEDVRKALGYERINLAGGSYGTRLAMEYVRAHERRVRTVMLDGAVPPSLRMPDGFGRAAQQALDGIVAECAASAACAKAFPNLRTEARAVFARLAAGPVKVRLSGVATEVAMTRDNVAEAIRYMTYSSRNAGRVPLLLHRAHGGDFTGIAEFLRRYRHPGTFEALYLSITCTEDVPFLPADAAARDEQTYLGSYRVRQQQAACREWPRGAVPSSHGTPVRSAVPVLITTGRLDPVTPPGFGDLVAESLTDALHVKVPSGAHGLYGLDGLECLDRIKLDFLNRATTAGLDTGCVKGIKRGEFATR